MKKILSLVLVAAIVALFAGVSVAADVKVGVDVELVYTAVEITNKSNTAGSGKDEIDKAGYGTTDADIDVSVAIDEKTSAKLKIDCDDSDAGDLEEVWIKFKKVADLPIDLKIGKQEVPFGQDKDLGITDPYVHGSTSDSFLKGQDIGGTTIDVSHFGEVDNKFGINIIASPLGDEATLELCVFENDTAQGAGTDDDKPADDGLTQSFAAKLTSSRVAGLKAEVSGIIMHREGQDLTAGMTDNSDAISVGLDFEMNPVNIYAEAIMGNDLGHVEGINQTVYSVGVAAKATDKVSVVAQWSAINTEEDLTGSIPEPKATKYSIAPVYKMDNGVKLLLEYAHEEYDPDQAGVKDLEADAILAKIKFKY